MSKQNYSYTSNWFNKIGRVVAILLSWTVNHSLGWGILHYLFGWWYVIYWMICQSPIENWVREYLMR